MLPALPARRQYRSPAWGAMSSNCSPAARPSPSHATGPAADPLPVATTSAPSPATLLLVRPCCAMHTSRHTQAGQVSGLCSIVRYTRCTAGSSAQQRSPLGAVQGLSKPPQGRNLSPTPCPHLRRWWLQRSRVRPALPAVRTSAPAGTPVPCHATRGLVSPAQRQPPVPATAGGPASPPRALRSSRWALILGLGVQLASRRL